MKVVNSKYVAIFISAVIVILHYYIRENVYNHWNNVLGWDVMAYYICLPFTFIYHDPGMVNHTIIDYIFDRYNPSGTFYQAYQLPNGNWVSMYSCGFAILFAPFFFIAHAWASTGAYAADGFSYPYQFCIANGVMIYIVAGVFLIRKVLLYFFSDPITSAVLILLLLGTNYFHEATSEEVMPHAILFAAYAWIILLNIKWHNNPKIKTVCWLGFASGFTILCRGSEVFIMLLPLLWNVYDVKTFKEKISFFIKHKKHLLFAGMCFMITPVIQMIQWKFITGSFVFSSYQNTEGFDWGGDHLLKVLFAYKKSWFLYTPMIVLPIIGIVLMRKMSKEAFLPVTLFFSAHFYVIASWAAWWQGGSFGMRYFVESYAVMAIPFGFFIKRISTISVPARLIIYITACFFLFLNLFQTWQFNNWIIDGYTTTKAYYWRVFLKTKATDEDKRLQEIHRDFKADEEFKDPENYNGQTLAFYNYDDLNTTHVDSAYLDSSECVSPPYSCKLSADRIYSPALKIPFNSVTNKEHFWIKASVSFYPEYDLKDNNAMLVLSFNHNNRYQLKYKAFDLGGKPYQLNQWNKLTVDYLTPYPLSENDVLEAYIYFAGKKTIRIDDFKVQAYIRKW